MDEYAGRVLAGRYRLPRSPADEFEMVETRALDAYSGQEVLVRQLLLPEVVHAELDGDGPGAGGTTHGGESAQRALDAARAAAAIPDHPRLVQVFDVLIEGGSLWVVSELVPARPVAALLAEAPLSPYRVAEVAADLLTGLRALHAHGWAHRNITVHTVLVCDDGRAMLDGLAFGAAQDALCGYDPVPQEVLTAAGGNDAPDHGGWGGPDPALSQERARQARITVVGPVTERWSPEQAAGPVRGNWQLAPPVGPAVDLWALGALLFRCVQGYPVFPEESATELVRLVCAEPPAYAEDSGPLRPVVESLLRQDPLERPEFEELRGWLRSLVRSAPEPDVGVRTVQMPSGDPGRLPIVRRKGEVVRQRKRRQKAEQAATAAEERAAAAAHGRHARTREQSPPPRPPIPAGPTVPSSLSGPSRPTVPSVPAGQSRPVAPVRPPAPLNAGTGTVPREYRDPRESRDIREPQRSAEPERRRGPRRLGLLLVALILAALLALVLYALLLMPHPKTGASGSLPAQVSSGGTDGGGTAATPSAPPSASPSAVRPTAPASPPAVALGEDFALREDPAGFTIAVHNGWTRSAGPNSETVYSSGGGVFRLIVVKGRDTAAAYGSAPVIYESKEPELAESRASSWTSISGPKSLDWNGSPAAVGGFVWKDPHSGVQLYAQDLAVLRGGRYDIVLLIGPDDQRQVVNDYFAKSAGTFRVGG